VNLVELPEIVQKNLVDVSPRLAQLILEKQKIKPPPPKKEQPREEKKKEPEKKKEEPKKPEPKKPEKKQVKKESAREVARKSGLIAMSDELADLRESFQLDDAMSLPQQTEGKKAVEVATATDLLSSSATKSSGGIKTDTLSRNIGTSELSQRKTTRVESKIESDEQIARASSAKKQASGTAKLRSADQIERVFQQNKGSIFNLYNRALRKNPMLAGQVVVELTIAPGGQVVDVRILSSELDDEALERKLVLRIKKFKFPGGNVAEMKVTYPIDFLPS
jgi:TonB family protein